MREWLASWRFLVSRRWLLFFLAIVVVGIGTWWLGEWQFGRLDDRRERNAVVEANEDRPPAPVDEVLAPGDPVAGDEEWRVITATGEYDADQTVLVRYRTRDGEPGYDAVVPLVTDDGATLVVDRGWLPEAEPGVDPLGTVPDPPAGEVTITGWVRADGTGESTEVDDRSVRAISSAQIGEFWDREVYGGFVELRSEDPEPADSLEPHEEPDLGEGPHFFYGLQWWFFGVLALGGFAYLAWDERKNGPRDQRRRAAQAAKAGRDDRSVS